MASLCKIVRWSLTKRNPNYARFFHNTNVRKTNYPACILYVVGGTITLFTAYSCRKFHGVQAAQSKEEGAKVVKLSLREKRFLRFASVEYNGQLYMTPQDFLESVVRAEPGPRLKRKVVLTARELERIKESTPPLSQGSVWFFRDLRYNGIISFTEYLFLLSIVTKPKSGFRIAFDIFDRDGNERVDKREFLVMEKIFSDTWKARQGLISDGSEKVILPIHEHYADDEQGLQKKHAVDTTLIVHLFGPKGNHALDFEDFNRFMLHLQTEVLEWEFSEFSKGSNKISEIDFARILLRYTHLGTDTYDMYLDRLLDRIKDTKGITFEEFNVFCQFLNNLQDFAIAMKMYALADYPLSKDEFLRAVKICTDTDSSSTVVDTVFALFDDDGDGLLSYRDFIAIMKDRLHRGFDSYVKTEGWEAFKHCIKRELRSPT